MGLRVKHDILIILPLLVIVNSGVVKYKNL